MRYVKYLLDAPLYALGFVLGLIFYSPILLLYGPLFLLGCVAGLIWDGLQCGYYFYVYRISIPLGNHLCKKKDP